MIRVWLPDPPQTLGGLPEGMVADVWTGGEPLPDSADEVEFIVLPQRVVPETLTRVARLPGLKVIQLTSAGAERVIPYIPGNVTLANARGAHDAATAEWTVGVIVAHLRDFPRFAAAQRDGRWDFTASESVAGKHVLIVGYGSIGAAVERRLAGWEVTIERLARTARPGTPGTPGVPGVLGMEDLHTALARADVVVLLVPVTDETRHLADAEFLASMKDGALLVNAARGAIVDTDALLKELNTTRIRAALDVTEPEPLPPGHPLWTAPGLLLTPHVGGAVTQARDRAYAIVRAQLTRYAVGEPLLNVIGARGY